MINSRGPSLDPWGTPALISNKLDLTPSITVHCFLFDKYDVNNWRQLSLIPICSSLDKRPLCQTLSKAADIS